MNDDAELYEQLLLWTDRPTDRPIVRFVSKFHSLTHSLTSLPGLVYTLCRYTDKIDVPFAKKTARFRAQMGEVAAMLTGIIMCLNYKAGQELVEDRDFAKYEKDFQRIIEVGVLCACTLCFVLLCVWFALCCLLYTSDAADE